MGSTDDVIRAGVGGLEAFDFGVTPHDRTGARACTGGDRDHGRVATRRCRRVDARPGLRRARCPRP